MAGAALSKMWETNPKLACFFQSVTCAMVGGFLIFFVLQSNKDWTLIVILALFEVIEGGSLVWFTQDAIKRGWARSDY